MSFSSSMPLEVLDRKHPEHVAFSPAWRQIDLLNAGGLRLRAAAGEFLTRRAKEPAEFYALRVQAFTYENILAPIIDWYRARMAGCHAEVSVESEESGSAASGLEAEWYGKFLRSCERPGGQKDVPLSTFLSYRFADLLLYGRAFSLVDKLPAAAGAELTTRLAQRQAGLLDPYLVAVPPSELIDWALSEEGDLRYAVIYCERSEREFGAEPKQYGSWYVYTPTEYAHYQVPLKEGKPEATSADLVAVGPHALSEVGRVPIIHWRAADGQWLADRAILSLRSHLDLLNANRFSTHQALLPMLVISGRFDDQAVRSEVAYLHIEDGDAKYLSPDPAVFTVAHSSLLSHKEEAYRQMHVQAQARTGSATAHAQSGLSKQEDMTAATDVLNGFGRDMQAYAASVMKAVIDARGDEGLRPAVSGWVFDEVPVADTMDAAERCDALQIGSPTFEREMKKRVVRVAVPDLPASTLQVIDREIEEAPTSEDRRTQEAAAAATALRRMAGERQQQGGAEGGAGEDADTDDDAGEGAGDDQGD